MKCRVCDGENLSLVIDLKDQPLGNHFLEPRDVGQEAYYPLRVVYCRDCQTAQLDTTVRKEIIYTHHTYLSGVTKSLSHHFQRVAADIDERFFKNDRTKSILDIGSNDGTALVHFKEMGYEVLGVDSTKVIVDIALQKGIPTLHAFFNLDVAKSIGKKFQVIHAAGVFFHLEELHSVTDGIKFLLDDNGVFVVQFLYMKNIMNNVAFDQIYHEHLLYYTLKTVNALLERHGLSLFDAYFSPIHGGSIIGFATHTGQKARTERLNDLIRQEDESHCNEEAAYLQFAKNIELLKEKNLEFLRNAKKLGKRIYGMGAPVKGNTLLNYFGIGKETLDCLVEKNPLRKGLLSPGKHIPIELENELSSPPDIYYVLAWNFRDEILKNNQALIEKGVEFYFPVNP
jgi:2-polyprenyl-3-methyl-5-hydroxy-6-metoxy-1,4-benzoquinol methylase